MSINYSAEVAKLAETVEPPERQIHPDAQAIAVDALIVVENKYGINGEDPRAYHNQNHSLDVPRRGIKFANILYPYIDPRFQTRLYDLTLIDGATHDIEQNLGPVANERAAGKWAIDRISKTNGPLNTGIFKQRVMRGELATAVHIDEEGRLIQTNLRTGSRDPIKLIMAYADINGIAMEGSKRMIQDATNLYCEWNAEPNAEEYCEFLISQAGFLKERLNDKQVKADIAYYFPENADEVYADMRNAFQPNIASAYSMAVLLGEKPELQRSVIRIVKSIGLIDRTLLGSTISNTLREKVSAEV